jgi:arsenical pump membrane protein
LAAAILGIVTQRTLAAVVAISLAALAALVADTGTDHQAFRNGVVVIVFLQAMLIIAAAAEHSGLLAWIAAHAARLAHRPSALLLATFAAGVLVTITLNLDTTAVLFTPLAIAVGRAAGQRTAPFALSAVLAANFGSVLLPSSNLTNLVIWRESDLTFAEFARTMAPIAVMAIAVTAVALWIASRRHLRAARVDAQDAPLRDRRLAVVSAAVVIGLMVVLLAGAPPVIAALVGVAVVVVARPSGLRNAPFSVALLGSLLGLFGAAAVLSASPWVHRLLAHLDTAPRVSLSATFGSALATNLATVAVLAPAAVTHTLTRALVTGVDLGVGLTPIGSLATVLWRDATRRTGDAVPMRDYLLIGIPLSIVLVAVGTAMS